MVERLATKTSEIPKQPQSLEEGLKAEGGFDSLHSTIKSLIRKVDRLEEPLLTLSQKETILIYILWMNKPKPNRIARLLGREGREEEIEEQINYVLKTKDQELEEAISRLAEHGKRISWRKGQSRTVDSELRKEVKRLKNEGYSRPDIAEKSGEPLGRIKYIVHDLRRDGEIE